MAVPQTPSGVYVWNTTYTYSPAGTVAVGVSASLGSDWASCDAAMIGWSVGSASSPANTVTGGSSTADNRAWLDSDTVDGYIEGLQPNTKYRFWVRVHNASGWSAWSAYHDFTTIGLPDCNSLTASTLTNVSAKVTVVVNTTAEAIDTKQVQFGWVIGKNSAPTNTSGYFTATLVGNPAKWTATGTISGLQPRTEYRFWARTYHASFGYGAWCSPDETTTFGPPDAPDTPTLSSIGQVAATVNCSANYNGGSEITAKSFSVDTENSAPWTPLYTYGDDSYLVHSLYPGTRYYVRARVKNQYGYSPWSTYALPIYTTPGCRVKVSGVWKKAVPWVKVAGVWQRAATLHNELGQWKYTS